MARYTAIVDRRDRAANVALRLGPLNFAFRGRQQRTRPSFTHWATHRNVAPMQDELPHRTDLGLRHVEQSSGLNICAVTAR